MIPLQVHPVATEPIHAAWLKGTHTSIDVLRLDAIHPVISGNKWFKLQYYLQDAQATGFNTIATFGGAWSNHIVATAYAGKLAGLHSVGIIRGEESPQLSTSLQQAIAAGMQLNFVTREAYRDKLQLKEKYHNENWYWIDEGGMGITGAKGAAEILSLAPDNESYTHIIAAVGTGTMLAGLVRAALPHQQIVGISSMKGNYQLAENVRAMSQGASAGFIIHHDYHFGGYARHPKVLIDFINDFYRAHQIPLDIVYTGKAVFATKDLIEKQVISQGSKVLFIHSGGLQGNNSLEAKVLAF